MHRQDRCHDNIPDGPQLLLDDSIGFGPRVRASDVAKQLTLIEMALWKLVSPLELQKAMWKNEAEEVVSVVLVVVVAIVVVVVGWLGVLLLLCARATKRCDREQTCGR